MRRLKVMVVDDSMLAAKKLEAILDELGHHVVKTVTSGVDAVSGYRDSRPDLVTMDITMPEMDGIEATGHLIRAFPEAKIIMITSHGQEAMVLAALNAGARGYVLKPVRSETLADMIGKVFAP